MRYHSRENKQALQWYKAFSQEALLQVCKGISVASELEQVIY